MLGGSSSMPHSFQQQLQSVATLVVKQRRELAEFVGYETRNKYAIEFPDGRPFAFAAEQQKGVTGFLLRQGLGHWRKYSVLFFNADRQEVLVARHPFSFIFQQMSIHEPNDRLVGKIVQRFAILSKKFDVLDATDNVLLTVQSPIWKIWTFPFQKNGVEVATVKKVWGGVLKEAFTDADTFQVDFGQALTNDERLLILAASIFVDIQYFEVKANK